MCFAQAQESLCTEAPVVEETSSSDSGDSRKEGFFGFVTTLSNDPLSWLRVRVRDCSWSRSWAMSAWFSMRACSNWAMCCLTCWNDFIVFFLRVFISIKKGLKKNI